VARFIGSGAADFPISGPWIPEKIHYLRKLMVGRDLFALASLTPCQLALRDDECRFANGCRIPKGPCECLVNAGSLRLFILISFAGRVGNASLPSALAAQQAGGDQQPDHRAGRLGHGGEAATVVDDRPDETGNVIITVTAETAMAEASGKERIRAFMILEVGFQGEVG
jgi:hypothetical protein